MFVWFGTVVAVCLGEGGGVAGLGLRVLASWVISSGDVSCIESNFEGGSRVWGPTQV